MKLLLNSYLIFFITWIGTSTAQDEALKRYVSALVGTFSSINKTSQASKFIASYQKIDHLHKPGTITLIAQEFNHSKILTVSYVRISHEGNTFVMRPILINPQWLARKNGDLSKSALQTLTRADLMENEGCTRRGPFKNSPPYHGDWPQWPKCLSGANVPKMRFDFDCKMCQTSLPKFGTFYFPKVAKAVFSVPAWKPANDPCP